MMVSALRIALTAATLASAPAPEMRPPLVIAVPVVVEPAATTDKFDEIVPVLSLMIVLPLPCWIWTTSTVAVSVPAFVIVLPLAASITCISTRCTSPS